MNSRPVFPELVTGRGDQYDDRAWSVRAGWALRGHASCDFAARVLEVPLGVTDVDRVIRAHELMHVRISPHDVNPLGVHPDISVRALECAEECRVNELLSRLGFQVDVLCDGSEIASGQRLGLNDAWDEAVFFFVAILGTGAERAFLKGVRRVRPDWIKPLGVLRRRVRTMLVAHDLNEMASTHRRDDDRDALPQGFEVVSVPLARLMMSVADAAVPEGADEIRQFRRSLEPGGRRPPTGRFAELVVDAVVQGRDCHPRRYARRDRPSVSGTALRYPSRLLVDPHQRAFAKTTPSLGGIVVVDQSGSMDLDHDEIDSLLARTPGATILGYSHRPGDLQGQVNAWVIARRGRRRSDVPTGNVGNGVDGPALRWALDQRQRGERVIWVTDGQVTDSNDHPQRALAGECAELVLRHRIVLVRTLAQAGDVLARRRYRSCESPEGFGRVGREIAQIWSVTRTS